MKKILLCAISALLVFGSECITLKITCRSKGVELTLMREAIDEWIKLTGNRHKVEIITLPHASNECFALYKQWLSAESFDVDVLQADVAWMPIFAECFADLNEFYKPGEIDTSDYFDAVRNSMYRDGRMIALPLYADCGIMYYRSDLLQKYGKPVPRTWEELYKTALYIQTEERKDPEKKNKFYGFVFQAKAFEMLTCNFTEITDSFGGAIVIDGRAAVNSDVAMKAVIFLIDCLKNISSKSVLNYSEEDARGMFQSGNAVFMRNWPYAWSLMNDPSTKVSGKTAVMVIPPSANGGKSSGVLGGWFMTVSKYSKHKKDAADLIKFLTSKARQRALSKYSYLPAFKSLYEDPKVIAENPFFGIVYHSLQNAVPRPSADFGKDYARASTEIFNAVNGILAQSIEYDMTAADVKKYLDRLNKKLDDILNKKNVVVRIKSEGGIWAAVKRMLGFGEK
ncbi:MAG: ABC transporter substrate-binding protein [Holosporaceae bacterium]|jgi:trehalose/maltose transport system substrate-binding protein|nr:ABC transporter substrate-binding protein [Holosporaceae bacterium]